MDTINLLVIDDHPLVREGIRMLLENHPAITLIGETDNVNEGLDLTASLSPDIVLLDLLLQDGLAVDAIVTMLDASPTTKILVLTGVLDEKIHIRAIRNGARGIVLKSSVSDVLIKAIMKVHGGELWLDRVLTAKLISNADDKDPFRDEENARIDSLTKRELEIVRLISEGHTNKFIAAALDISEKTVRNHLTVIYSKLQLASRLELAVFAAQAGIAS